MPLQRRLFWYPHFHSPRTNFSNEQCNHKNFRKKTLLVNTPKTTWATLGIKNSGTTLTAKQGLPLLKKYFPLSTKVISMACGPLSWHRKVEYFVSCLTPYAGFCILPWALLQWQLGLYDGERIITVSRVDGLAMKYESLLYLNSQFSCISSVIWVLLYCLICSWAEARNGILPLQTILFTTTWWLLGDFFAYFFKVHTLIFKFRNLCLTRRDLYQKLPGQWLRTLILSVNQAPIKHWTVPPAGFGLFWNGPQ